MTRRPAATPPTTAPTFTSGFSTKQCQGLLVYEGIGNNFRPEEKPTSKSVAKLLQACHTLNFNI